jgi:hypothetical protein
VASLEKKVAPEVARLLGMRITLNIVGAVLVLCGGVWFLQGINVLPGSFMTGQIRWAQFGGIAVAAGAILLWTANRRGLTGRR